MTVQSSSVSSHAMRRKDRQQPLEKGLALLEVAEWGVLSLTGSDGAPYGIPFSFALDPKAEQQKGLQAEPPLPDVVLHAAQEGRKLDCLAHESRAVLTVVGATEVLPEKFSTNYLSAMAFGRVVEVTEAAEKLRLLMRLAAKYSPGLDNKAEAYARSALGKTRVLRLVVDEVSVKGRMG